MFRSLNRVPCLLVLLGLLTGLSVIERSANSAEPIKRPSADIELRDYKKIVSEAGFTVYESGLVVPMWAKPYWYNNDMLLFLAIDGPTPDGGYLTYQALKRPADLQTLSVEDVKRRHEEPGWSRKWDIYLWPYREQSPKIYTEEPWVSFGVPSPDTVMTMIGCDGFYESNNYCYRPIVKVGKIGSEETRTIDFKDPSPSDLKARRPKFGERGWVLAPWIVETYTDNYGWKPLKDGDGFLVSIL